MKHLSRTICTLLIFLGTIGLQAQEAKEISLEGIYRSGKFYPSGLHGLRSMNDGIHYTIQQGSKIVKYSYKSGDKVEVLFDASKHPEISRFGDYEFDSKENKILIETDRENIYRHSYSANFWVYDRLDESLLPVSESGRQQLSSFSPDGTKVAFVRDNNIYITNLADLSEKQITRDGLRNHIINGAPDWVYEEEFGFSRGFHWSPDGTNIAYYRFDESGVREFHMTMFGDLYPEKYEFKYPKAGEDNSLVTIHVYNCESGESISMDTGEETDQYIPRIKWTNDSETLSIIRLNRLQNNMDILHASAGDGNSKLVYSETNKYYISEASDKTITYLPDGKSFILNSEQSGYFQLYHYNFETGSIKPITAGRYDIDDFLGYDEKSRQLFYTSYEESSIEKHLYSIRIDGNKKKKLSTEAGTNRATFSKNFEYFILNHSSANSPAHISLHNKQGKLIRVLEDNERMNLTMEEYGFAPTEFITVPTRSGQELNAYIIKPADFDPSKTYPLFMFVYGGPESQKVIDSWDYRGPWFQMLTQKGYIVACVDNRGTNGRGEAFRKATYLTLGKYETIDQVESAQWFGSQEYIDSERIGIFGWSYGGFMTSLCLTKGKGTFKMGIAVAPVSNWRYYDNIYTERFMRTPAENAAGYDDNSPINFADQLQGKFLLIHGSGDDNVHYQNSMDFVEALVQANKQFEMQFYPNKNHGIRGGNTTFHLYTRMTDFILENL